MQLARAENFPSHSERAARAGISEGKEIPKQHVREMVVETLGGTDATSKHLHRLAALLM